MADKKESNEDILRAILEKGGARFKEQVAKELARQEPAPAAAPAKKRKKSLKGVAGSFGETKYYYGPGGIIVDKEGKPAPESFAKMFAQKDEMADQVKSAIMPKSLRPIEGEINKAITQTSKLSKTQDAIYAKTPAIFGELDKTIQNLTQQHENIVRQLIQQNQDLQDKVIEALTGQKAATRAGGSVAPKRIPKGATRAVGGSRAAAATPTKAAYQKARITKPAAVKARQEAMMKAREEKTQRMVRKGMIVGAGLGAAAGILSNMMGGGGGQTPSGGGGGGTSPGGGASPGATPSAVPGMVKLVTPGGREYTVAAQYASNFKGFVDELENSGYKINSIGGYANRNIAGTGTKSYHSLGVAIDINPSTNPHLFDGRTVTDMPANVGSIAAKYGLGWGGNWSSSKDTMHFSMAKGEGGSVPIDRSGVTPLPGAPESAATASTAGAPSASAGGPVNPGVISAPGAASPSGGPSRVSEGQAGEKPMGKAEFNQIMEAAKRAGDPFPEVTAGQWAIESGWGKHMTGANNPFGQTGIEGRDPGRRIPTPRDPGGGSKFFRDFQTIDEAVAFRVNKWNSWYVNAKTPEEALMMLQNYGRTPRYAQGYNNDWMSYVTSISGIIRTMGIDPKLAKTPGGPEQPQTASAPVGGPEQNPGVISAPGATPPSGAPPGGQGEPQRTPAAAGELPPGDIVSAGKWLQGQGIRVSENPSFGGVNPVHRGRGHYEGRAIDVNAGYGVEEAYDPVWGPRFDEIAAKAKAAGYTVIWRSAGHYNHMHIEVPAGGPQTAQGTTPQAAPPPMNAPSMVPQRPGNPGIAFNQASRGMTIQQDMLSQMQNVLPIIMNNTQYVNNTRTIIRSQPNISRASDGFDPLATVAAVAGFAIGKGLRGLF